MHARLSQEQVECLGRPGPLLSAIQGSLDATISTARRRMDLASPPRSSVARCRRFACATSPRVLFGNRFLMIASRA
jgi:hypothetical protein